MLAAAVSRTDPAAALDAMAPEEVKAISRTLGTTESRARKLGFSGRDGTYDGIDLEVRGLKLSTQKLSDDVARVTVEGGRVSWKVDPERFGASTRTALAARNSDFGAGRGTYDLRRLRPDGPYAWTGYDEPASDPYVITLRRKGRWYVSPAYTAAEYFVSAADLPGGQFTLNDSAESKPAESPEQAVTEFAEHAGAINVDGVIDDLGTAHWSVLSAYRQAIKSEFHDQMLESGADPSLGFENWNLAVSDLPGGMRKVSVTAVTMTSRWVDDDNGPQERRIYFDGRCFKYRDGDGYPRRECFTRFSERAGLNEIFFVTVPDGGGWRISPLDTFGQYANRILDHAPDELIRDFLGVPPTGKPDRRVRAATSMQDVSVKLDENGTATIDIYATPRSLFFADIDTSQVSLTTVGSDGQPVRRIVPDDGRITAILRNGHWAILSDGSDTYDDEADEATISFMERPIAPIAVGDSKSESLLDVGWYDAGNGGETLPPDEAYYALTLAKGTKLRVSTHATVRLPPDLYGLEEGQYSVKILVFDQRGNRLGYDASRYGTCETDYENETTRISGDNLELDETSDCTLKPGNFLIMVSFDSGGAPDGANRSATVDTRLDRR